MSEPTSAPRWKRLVIWLSVAVAVVAIGFGAYRLFFQKSDGPRWVTAKVTKGDVTQVVNATGTIQPLLLSPVGSQVSGIVHKLHADFNDSVRQGQVLVELDPATVAKARAAFGRSKGFHGFELHKSIEKPQRYRLMVKWETLENHTVDFRGSENFTEWRGLVGQYFAAPPEVEHTSTVVTT